MQLLRSNNSFNIMAELLNYSIDVNYFDYIIVSYDYNILLKKLLLQQNM